MASNKKLVPPKRPAPKPNNVPAIGGLFGKQPTSRKEMMVPHRPMLSGPGMTATAKAKGARVAGSPVIEDRRRMGQAKRRLSGKPAAPMVRTR